MPRTNEDAGEVVANNKLTLYLGIACGVLVLTLIVVAVLVYMNGGSPAGPAGIAAGAAVAAAEAVRRRNAARTQVQEVRKEVLDTSREISDNKASTDADVVGVKDEIDRMSDEQLKDEGNRLFGGKP